MGPKEKVGGRDIFEQWWWPISFLRQPRVQATFSRFGFDSLDLGLGIGLGFVKNASLKQQEEVFSASTE